MNKQVLFLAILCGWGLGLFAQEKMDILLDNYGIRVSAEMVDGRLYGKYLSHYTNGKKCAKGQFDNGFRIGKWTIWDSLGKKKIVRLYKSPYTFKQVFPAATDSTKPLPYTPKRSLDGSFEYFLFDYKDLYAEKLIWRSLGAEKNPLLFANNKLYNLLMGLINNKTIRAYDDENFRVERILNSTNLKDMELAYFKIREIFCIDTKRQLGETRILSLCPVVRHIRSKEEKELCWFSFADLSPHLLKQSVSSEKLPFGVSNLYDVFFYRCFYGQIIKEANMYNRSLLDYIPEQQLVEESNKIEVDMLEMEHKIWLNLLETK